MGGSDLSVTEGIVSRIEYTGFDLDRAGLIIQIDAAINPGNSGGPALVENRLWAWPPRACPRATTSAS